ncbi:serum amyloid P-component-like [Grus japonensis]|uniref:C-reactive protein n=1 Tax=Grus japonensis TaxID=30415 RepID=A0ABC9XTS6_GRUJA
MEGLRQGPLQAPWGEQKVQRGAVVRSSSSRQAWQVPALRGIRFVSFSIPKSISGSKHICASWESTTSIMGFWFNRKPCPCKGLQRGYAVEAEVAIMLGQKQDAFGAASMPSSPSWGKSRPCVWDTEFSTSGVIAAMHDSPDEAPICGWRNFLCKMMGEVYLKA